MPAVDVSSLSFHWLPLKQALAGCNEGYCYNVRCPFIAKCYCMDMSWSSVTNVSVEKHGARILQPSATVLVVLIEECIVLIVCFPLDSLVSCNGDLFVV